MWARTTKASTRHYQRQATGAPGSSMIVVDFSAIQVKINRDHGLPTAWLA
jgi:hypothetical protein